VRIDGIASTSVKFSFSPLQEVLRALHVLADPRHHAEQMAWLRGVRRRMTPSIKAGLRRFAFLLIPVPELFADLLPSPRATTFDREVILLGKSLKQFRAALVRRMLDKRLISSSDLIQATRPAALKRLATEASQRWPGNAPLFWDFIADSKGLLDDFCQVIAAFFECGLAAQWERFESLAWDDAALRKRLLQRFGVAAMLRTLTRELTVDGDRRRASVIYGGKESAGTRLELPGNATIALTPSYFIWPHATFVVLKRVTLDVRIAYPLASPVTACVSGGRWSEAAKSFTALSDPLRLQMLELLRQRDLSTREFAGLLRLSEGAVSRHLSILRNAGLVTSVRDGYFVLYRRAPDGLSRLVERVAILDEE
jgi:DNA-binding transcriptional ArsR family regulator